MPFLVSAYCIHPKYLINTDYPQVIKNTPFDILSFREKNDFLFRDIPPTTTSIPEVNPGLTKPTSANKRDKNTTSDNPSSGKTPETTPVTNTNN